MQHWFIVKSLRNDPGSGEIMYGTWGDPGKWNSTPMEHLSAACLSVFSSFFMSPLELWRFTTRKNWLGTTYSTRVFNSLWQEADFRSWLSGYLEGYVCDFFGPFSSHSSPFHSSVLTFVNYSFTNNQTIKQSQILYASSPRSFFMAISTPISWIPTGRTWLYQKNWFTSCKLSWIGLARMLHLLPRKS